MGVLVQKRDRVVLITIDRPDVLNAMDPEAYAAIDHALMSMDQDDDIRVGIVTGTGDRAFSAGADLERFHTEDEVGESWGPWRPDRWDFGLSTSKPLIAAVNGYALGGGLELALLCDIRIASWNAKFGAPEVKWGLLGAMDTYRLPKTVGLSNAMLLLLTGEPIGAQEALRMGIVSLIVKPDELLTAAMSLAERIANNPPSAVRMTKELALRGLDLSFEDHLRLSKAYGAVAASSGEQEEGRKAFAERRASRH
jgi:E-phenylitaconyl-CoA hydratase